MWPLQSGVLDPQGPIGAAERTILLNATAIMLAVVVPVIILTLTFAWWFRSGNRSARYLPDWSYSGRIEVIVWSIPALVVMFLGGIAWIGSHDLDPHRPIAGSVSPINIQVVSMDWKWLFIYPDQGVASVNRLVVPANTPIRFQLTSESVMNSFFVPQLGSQIYTMARMTTHLNLQADQPGRYRGLSAQFSGAGFSDMHFEVVAMPSASFEQWVTDTRGGSKRLDQAAYTALAQPGLAAEPVAYGSIAAHLFDAVVKGDVAAAVMPDPEHSAHGNSSRSGN
jgi:cytochrome o ubiquinol oxidase subunit 2